MIPTRVVESPPFFSCSSRRMRTRAANVPIETAKMGSAILQVVHPSFSIFACGRYYSRMQYRQGIYFCTYFDIKYGALVVAAIFLFFFSLLQSRTSSFHKSPILFGLDLMWVTGIHRPPVYRTYLWTAKVHRENWSFCSGCSRWMDFGHLMNKSLNFAVDNPVAEYSI